MINMRGIPTAACPSCGSTLLQIKAIFDLETYELQMYMLDCECASCGTLLTAPTPADQNILGEE